ncbi:18S rRNA maturation protein [Malassezia nana]|uniref:rRNA-processing protein EFG1 n=1 Tax=Malassezia nana TaxID=180528 RepID=A0AAF0J8Z1_9BASI|nr:18S rRNA maturation protein [Malassezia nana]
MGANKIKSLLRQTKRLLSKESLAPGVRIEAERKYKALEHELEVRTQSNKERTMAARYHKVKFFERQKLVRRIRQCKRALASNERAKPWRTKLFESRVMLNYVLHFPAHQRYVALFADRERKDPVAPDAQASDRAQVQAAEFLASVRKSMKRGEMSAEPEMELEQRQAAKAKEEEEEGGQKEEDVDDEDEEDVDEDEEDDVDDEDEEDVEEDETPAPHTLAQDDFFAL